MQRECTNGSQAARNNILQQVLLQLPNQNVTLSNRLGIQLMQEQNVANAL